MYPNDKQWPQKHDAWLACTPQKSMDRKAWNGYIHGGQRGLSQEGLAKHGNAGELPTHYTYELLPILLHIELFLALGQTSANKNGLSRNKAELERSKRFWNFFKIMAIRPRGMGLHQSSNSVGSKLSLRLVNQSYRKILLTESMH